VDADLDAWAGAGPSAATLNSAAATTAIRRVLDGVFMSYGRADPAGNQVV